MIKNGTHGHINIVFENVTDKTIKENSMNHGDYEAINNKEFYYQKAFNIAVILGQLLCCSNALKE